MTPHRPDVQNSPLLLYSKYYNIQHLTRRRTVRVYIKYDIVKRREEEIGRLSTLSALQRIDVYARVSGTLQQRRLRRGW